MSDATAARVLVGDDQSDILTALRLLLCNAGFQVDTATSVQELRNRLQANSYDLMLMDLNYVRDTTSGREGLELLADVHERDPLLPIVVMTGWGSIDTAVEAMRRGARGFVNKPWDNEGLTAAICREVEDGRALRRAERDTQREQQEAQAIQRSLLPADLPSAEGCRMAARWTPAAAFGGDCYDVLRIDHARIACWIGDVCGKGLPAALVMANLQASTRAFATADSAPRAVVSRVNAELVRQAGLRRFVTFFYAVYDTAARRLTYTNAGHNPPAVMRPNAVVERLTTGGMILGACADASFDEATITLTAGDRLMLFTDGITEAWSPDEEEFGDERLLVVLSRHRRRSALGIVDTLFGEVTRFAAGNLQDDATVFVVAVD